MFFQLLFCSAEIRMASKSSHSHCRPVLDWPQSSERSLAKPVNSRAHYCARAHELRDLPHGLSDMASIQLVRDWYEDSFDETQTLEKWPAQMQTREWVTTLPCALWQKHRSGGAGCVARGIRQTAEVATVAFFVLDERRRGSGQFRR